MPCAAGVSAQGVAPASSSGAFPASRGTWSPACPGLPSWASLKQISHGLRGLGASGSRHHQPFASHTRLSLTQASEPRDHPASCQLRSHTFSRGHLWVITSCPKRPWLAKAAAKGYSHTADPQAPRETWELLDHPLQVTANPSACSTKRPQHIKA